MDNYNWDMLFEDMAKLNSWIIRKPKWWKFRKYRKWKKSDPRKYWR